MKKTLLKVSAILFVVMVLILAGCEQPTDYSLALNSLAGPKNLKANTDNKGGVLLTWEPSINAASYEVWRAEWTGNNRGVFVQVKTDLSKSSVRYADVISDGNLLKDSTKYTYKVVAVSANSTGTNLNANVVVQNGESNVDLTTKADQFPAKGTADLVGTVTDIAITVDPIGRFIATWAEAADKNPLVQYHVFASTGTDFTVNNNGVSATTSTPYFSNSITGTGDLYVAVKAQLGDGLYYPASALEIASTDYTIIPLNGILASPVGLTAARKTAPLTTAVEIAYNAVPGVTYELKKYQLPDPGLTGTWSSLLSLVPEESWINVPTTGAVPDTTGKLTLIDTNIAIENAYVYRLKLRSGYAESATPSYAKVTASATAASSVVLSIGGGPIAGVTLGGSTAITTADPDTTNEINENVYEVRFAFQGEAGAMYTVYSQLTADNVGTAIVDAPWNVVANTTTTAGAEDLVIIHAPLTQPRHQFNYRIVGTKTGKTDANVSFTVASPLTALTATVAISGTQNTADPWYRVSYSALLLPGEQPTVWGYYVQTGPSNNVNAVSSEQLPAATYYTTAPTGAAGGAGYFFQGKATSGYTADPTTNTGVISNVILK